MAALHLTTENFRREVLEYEGTELVDFWASWCGPCQMVGPIVEEIANEVTDAKICKVNVDEQPDIAGKYNCVQKRCASEGIDGGHAEGGTAGASQVGSEGKL